MESRSIWEQIARVLALADNGERLMPLAEGSCCSEEAREGLRGVVAEKLFPSARAPRGALSGLYLYFSCRDEAHEVAQEDPTAEGSYWHAIVHRQEPDAGNAAYWFRRVGTHPVVALLTEEFGSWNPIAFIDRCAPVTVRVHVTRLFERCRWSAGSATISPSSRPNSDVR